VIDFSSKYDKVWEIFNENLIPQVFAAAMPLCSQENTTGRKIGTTQERNFGKGNS
jgi:hypothetical protein